MLKALIEELARLKVGELRNYKQLEIIIGKNPQKEGRTIILAAIRRLRRPPYGISILNMQKIGYFRASMDRRADWVSGRREHVRRTLVEGYLSSVVVDENELKTATEEQKKKLLIEASKTGFELLLSNRIERAKRLPDPTKFQSMSSYLGELIEKQKGRKS